MKKVLTLAALPCLLIVTACATLNVDLPSINESASGDRLAGKIVWRDLLTDNPAASKRFYGELYGWEFESVGTDSNLSGDSADTLVPLEGRLIGGMVDTVALNNRRDISQWVVLMSVADVNAAVDKARSAGAEIVAPPTDLKRRGRLAVVRDAEGALAGFLMAAALPASYRVLTSGETPRAGIMPVPLEDLHPVWVSYIRTDNSAAVAARVEDLGGHIIVAAQARPVGGKPDEAFP